MFQQATPLETTVANAQALGELRLLERLIELDYESFSRSFDDEYIRLASARPRGAGETS